MRDPALLGLFILPVLSFVIDRFAFSVFGESLGDVLKRLTMWEGIGGTCSSWW